MSPIKPHATAANGIDRRTHRRSAAAPVRRAGNGTNAGRRRDDPSVSVERSTRRAKKRNNPLTLHWLLLLAVAVVFGRAERAARTRQSARSVVAGWNVPAPTSLRRAGARRSLVRPRAAGASGSGPRSIPLGEAHPMLDRQERQRSSWTWQIVLNTEIGRTVADFRVPVT